MTDRELPPRPLGAAWVSLGVPLILFGVWLVNTVSVGGLTLKICYLPLGMGVLMVPFGVYMLITGRLPGQAP